MTAPSTVDHVSRLEDCEHLWRQTIPQKTLADLWEFRACFHRHFDRPLRFLTGDHGLLPLSFIEETGCFGYFPGETWRGETWIEQNRLPALDAARIGELLDDAKTPSRLRYLAPTHPSHADLPVDEIGYLFTPARYQYSLDRYLASLPNKRLNSKADDLSQLGQAVTYRYDVAEDFNTMIEMSLTSFGTQSYFHDPRFRAAFADVVALLRMRGWLRQTTALVDGVPAAVDVGCVFDGIYTVLAGATDARFLGIAKLINLHHMEWACRQRLSQVDFQCGDFSWKELFRLERRPLHRLETVRAA